MRKTKLFILLTFLLSIGLNSWADGPITEKVWDFTTLSDADKSALTTDVDDHEAKFTDNTSNKYVGNKSEWTANTDYQLEDANGDVIATYDGLLFGRDGNTVSAGSFRFYYGSGAGAGYIYFNNSNCYIKLPSIKAGQEVVITSKTYNIVPTVDNANDDITTSVGEQKFTVKANGTVKIKFNPKMADLQSIEVRDKVVDTTAPTLSSTTPAYSATNVLLDGNIVLTFDESVKKVGDNITATLNGSSITGTADGASVTFAYEGLSTSNSYTFTLPANQVSDIAGNNYASAVNITFTTIGSSVVWPFKATALDQTAIVYVSPSTDIASYVIEKGSNVKNFVADAVKGTYAFVNTSNADYDDDTFIYFKITPATGKAFVPTAVEYDASKVSSDNPRIQAYWVNGDGIETAIGSEINPVRDAPSLVSESVTNFTLANGACGLKLKFKGGSTNKGIGLWNIKLIGTVIATEAVSTLDDRYYGTHVTTNKLDFSKAEGVQAFIATGFNSGKTGIVLQEVEVVPASTAIIIKTEDYTAKTIYVPVSTDDADDVSSNALVAGDGTTEWDGTAGYTYYYLASDLFHKATSGTLQSGKAYLKVLTSEAPEAPSAIRIVDEESGATNIEAIDATEEAVKFFQNGKLYIKKNNVVYDMMGTVVR